MVDISSLDDTVQPAHLQCVAGVGSPQSSLSEDERSPSANDDSNYEWVTEEERARIIEDVWRLYNDGVPLYTSAQLRDLDQQMARRLKTVSVTGIDGVQYLQNGTLFRRESKKGGMWDPPFITFSSIESLVSRPPEWPYTRSMAYCPLHISHRRSDNQELNSVEETSETFIKCKQEWESSEPCRLLKHTLASGSLPKSITKIKEQGVTCKSIRKNLRICEQVLGPHDITILEGVKGFLEVDSSTLVFTVAPNVPVKQIVADLAKPAIMVWDSIESVEEERTVWTKRPSRLGAGDSWLSPYGTNPDSPRVRSMVQNEYALFPFTTHEEKFGHLEIYIRKE